MEKLRSTAEHEPEHNEEWKETWIREQNKKTNLILSRYRHDWMNEFQLIIGYVRLKKYDRIEEFLQKVIHRAREESKLSLLGDTSLILYLVGFNALHTELELKATVEPPSTGDGVHISPPIASYLIQIIESYRTHAIHNDLERNLLNFKMSWDSHRRLVCFTYQGELDLIGWKASWESLIHPSDVLMSNRFISTEPSLTQLIVEIPIEV